MPVFDKERTIFIRVPKTASTSMNMAFGPGGQGPMHETALGIKDRISDEKFDKFFKFGFVRNPWDWLLSWITYKQEASWNGWDKFGFNNWIEGIGNVMDSRGGCYWSPGYEFRFIGEGAVSCGLKQCRAHMGFSCCCMVQSRQYEFLCDKNKKPMVDFVGRFENIGEDWEHVANNIYNYEHKELGLENKSNHSHYRDVYNDRTSEIVYNLLKDDIELFNYSF